jgi:hypothetical protein
MHHISSKNSSRHCRMASSPLRTCGSRLASARVAKAHMMQRFPVERLTDLLLGEQVRGRCRLKRQCAGRYSRGQACSAQGCQRQLLLQIPAQAWATRQALRCQYHAGAPTWAASFDRSERVAAHIVHWAQDVLLLCVDGCAPLAATCGAVCLAALATCPYGSRIVYNGAQCLPLGSHCHVRAYLLMQLVRGTGLARSNKAGASWWAVRLGSASRSGGRSRGVCILLQFNSRTS